MQDTFDKDSISINKVWANYFEKESGIKSAVLGIYWSCNLGYGEYILVFDGDGIIKGFSERMDTNEDKEFLRALFDKILEKIDIID